jgi:hypothetical protein
MAERTVSVADGIGVLPFSQCHQTIIAKFSKPQRFRI